MIRQQTTEARAHRVAITDDDGLPLTGLTPTALAWKASDGTALTAPTVTEIAGGFYRIVTGALAEDAMIRVDRGTAGPGRYVFLEAVVGGYVDNVDATISSRATSSALATLDAAVTALGSPSQAADLTTAQADLTTLIARLTALRAAALDLLDVAISTRASSAEVAGLSTVVVTPGVRSG